MNGLSDIAIRKIFGQLGLRDRARLKVVSKSWNSMLSRHDIPKPPEIPWQIIPGTSCFNSDSYMTLIDFDVGTNVHRFELPKFQGNVCGGWFCGSSDGWLVLASGLKLEPDMFLWNPLNGSVMKLPPLSKLSFLNKLLKSGQDVYNISSYIKRVHVFSPEFVVAVVVSDTNDGGQPDYLALSTPKDKEWVVLESDCFYSFHDILFHGGKLYALAKHVLDDGKEDSGVKDKRKKAMYQIFLSICVVEVRVLCLDYTIDKPRGDVKSLYNVKNPLFNVTYDDKIWEHLVEFSGELLVMSAIYDLYTYNSNGFGPVKTFKCHQIQRIEVRRVDGLERVESLLIGQDIVLADTGSFPFRRDGERASRIYFKSDHGRGIVGDGDDKEQCVVRERCIFNLANSTMHEYHVEYIKHPSQCRIGWLTPKLA